MRPSLITKAVRKDIVKFLNKIDPGFSSTELTKRFLKEYKDSHLCLQNADDRIKRSIYNTINKHKKNDSEILKNHCNKIPEHGVEYLIFLENQLLSLQKDMTELSCKEEELNNQIINKAKEILDYEKKLKSVPDLFDNAIMKRRLMRGLIPNSTINKLSNIDPNNIGEYTIAEYLQNNSDKLKSWETKVSVEYINDKNNQTDRSVIDFKITLLNGQEIYIDPKAQTWQDLDSHTGKTSSIRNSGIKYYVATAEELIPILDRKLKV